MMADKLDYAWEALLYYGIDYEGEGPELSEDAPPPVDEDYNDWFTAWEAA